MGRCFLRPSRYVFIEPLNIVLAHKKNHLGYYADAVLKFRLAFPENYPETPPAVNFLTDVFHPLISSTGSFNLSPRFRPWR